MAGLTISGNSLRSFPSLENHPHVPKKEEKIKALIKSYDWANKNLLDPSLLGQSSYCDFLDFLYTSKLFHFIRGYETSLKNSESPLKEGISILNGEPHLYKDGKWTHWKEIIAELEYDPQQREIVTKNSLLEWNYVYPRGLIQQSRYNWIEPVHQLNEAEMDKLYEQGSKFCKSNEQVPLKEKCGFIQVFTAGKSRLGQLGHVGFRMIDRKGHVYSFGFETPNNEAEIALSRIFSSLATYNVTIASLDFKEFRRFDIRRTTTIPITEDQFHATLEKIKGYATTPIRFNMLHQSCVTFASHILKTVGVDVEVKTTSIARGVYDLIMPAVFKISYIGPVIKKIISVVDRIFTIISEYTPKPICFLAKVITFIPCIFLNMIKNSVLLMFGAGKQGSAPKSFEINTGIDNSAQLMSFHRLFNHWTDFFKEDSIVINLPHRVSDWQMEQGSTEITEYIGPQFYVVPQNK